jgi:PadR family transcriptional regulator, regulatory protein PadR
MTKIESSTLYGNLNLLILRALEAGEQHGLAIARDIMARSGEVLRIEEGALYPALHRLERDGYVKGKWGQSEQNRRAKYYVLTRSGRALLERERENWLRHAEAVAKVLGHVW